jgi:SAM-dependent methyltransferase
MRARWFIERVRAGIPITPKDWDRLTQETHNSDPGRTPAAFGVGRDSLGRSSYQLLAAALDSAVTSGSDGLTVLDLACGGGEALFAVMARFPGRVRGIGVDRAIQELRRARRGPAADVVVAAAQRLPLRANCCDAVVCHLALMLFVDLAAVVEEVARVLRPGGQFAAVVQVPRPPADTPPGKVRRAAAAVITDAWRETFAAPMPTPSVGAELFDDERLAELFGPSRGFAGTVRREQLTLEMRTTPRELWDSFFATLYPLWAVDETLRGRTVERLAQSLAPFAAEDGTVGYELALELLTTHRA